MSPRAAHRARRLVDSHRLVRDHCALGIDAQQKHSYVLFVLRPPATKCMACSKATAESRGLLAGSAMKAMKYDSITEQSVGALVERFYAKVRCDAVLAPIFENVLAGRWDEHVATMREFWCSALRVKRDYRGDVLAAHQRLGRLPRSLFPRWLALFRERSMRISRQRRPKSSPIARSRRPAISRARSLTPAQRRRRR